MSDLEVWPAELTAAAAPLREAGRVLRALADDWEGVNHLADGSPSATLRVALQGFVAGWELLLWSVGGKALALSGTLEQAAAGYALVDDGLGRELRR